LQSREFYEKAIGFDPGFAPAHSGLAMALISSVLIGLAPARVAMPMARGAAQRGLDLDPTLQEALAVLGMIAALYDFDWNQAASRFRLAESREPVPPYVRWYHSFSYLLPMGRLQEAAQECTRGIHDDPLNFIGRFHYAGALLAAGRTEAGEQELRELSHLFSNQYQPFYLLSLSQALQGACKEALAAAEHAYALAPWSVTTKALLAGTLKRTGETQRSDDLIGKAVPDDRYGVPMGRLLYHLACSEIQEGAFWAGKVIEQRDPRIILPVALLRAQSPEIFRSSAEWSEVVNEVGVPA
jgi:tetratricopeptide (TPR) repeat protein